jgi:diguanylate cyclase (GGDEF)-like protein
MTPATGQSLFVLSPRYPREVTEALGGFGWNIQIERRADEVAQAFAATEARIAVVDARGALVAGLSAARELAPDVEARHGALVVLLSRNDTDAEGAVHACGATQVLTSPFTAAQLVIAVRMAWRHVSRIDTAVSGQIPESALARRDVLTGLATPMHARGWVDLLLGAPQIGDPAVIIVAVAIGRFGHLNAAYGHAVADALLQAVAIRLRGVAAAVSAAAAGADPRMVARLAGAEFAVILAGPVTLGDATMLAQNVIDALEPAFAVEGHLIHLSCRIGIAAADAAMRLRDDATDRLFRHASAALVMARARGPGSVEVFQPVDGEDPMTRMADLESDLRRTLEADALEILFQPQVGISSGRIVGVEALVRWQHPVFGELPAQTLFEVAESAEVAIQLGDRIRARALDIAGAPAPDLTGLTLSINLTAAELRAPNLVDKVLDDLERTGFPRYLLTLEVTESDVIENLETAAATLAELRAHGIRIALDDFGTGYSSLAYLRELPLDSLKIDRKLINDLVGSERDSIVVKGVVEMARALDIRTIAEGVENPAQLAAVRDTGCDCYQGFLCSAPLRAHELSDFVVRWNATADIEGRSQ